MPTKTWIATTAQNWNTAGNWSPSGVPAATDDVIFNGSANGNCTLATTTGLCNSLVMTGYTGTFTLNIGLTISGSDNTLSSGNSLTLSSGATYSGTNTITFTSTVGGNITSNGKAMTYNITINGVGSIYTIIDDLSITGTLTLTNGTLTVDNGSNVTCNAFSSNTSNTRSLNMGWGTWNITGALGATPVFNLTTSTNMTLNAQQSRVLVSNTSATLVTLALSSLTYYTVEYGRGGGGGNVVFSGSPTIVNFIDVTSTAAHALTFTAATTTSFHRFNVRGSAGALVTINRSGATNPTLTKVGKGVVCYSDYITMGTVSGTPSSTWYIGANSTIGTSSGFIATNAPSSQSLLGIGGVG